MDTRTPQHRDINNPDDLLATIGRKAVAIEHLEEENASLRAQLSSKLRNDASLANRNMLISPAPSSQDTGSTVLTTDMVPKPQYESLVTQYAELKASHEALTMQHDAMRKKWRESKSLIKQWQIYIKRVQERERKAGSDSRSSLPPPPAGYTGHVSAAQNDTEVTPRAVAVAPNLVTADSDRDGGSRLEMSSSPPRRTPIPDRTVSQPALHTSLSSADGVTSSQTTVDDPEAEEELSLVQAAPSSDFEPIVVSTRCLKRKTGPGRGEKSPVRRIKREPDSRSSSPRRTPDVTRETISSDDCLDNFGPAMITPRRPKRVNDLRLRATSEEIFRSVPQLRRSASSLSDGNVDALNEQSTLEAMPLDTESVNAQVSATSFLDKAGVSNPRSYQNQHSGVLKHISGNVPRYPRTPEDQGKSRAKARRTGAKDKILLVAEDGDDGSSQSMSHPQHQQDIRSPDLPADGRLDDLLNGPSQERTPVLPRLAAPPDVPMDMQRRSASFHLRTPVSVVKRASPVKPTTGLRRTPVRAETPPSRKPAQAIDRAVDLARSPPPVRPEEEPLRIRPISTLRLEDFKINPRYMGTHFAFADTIRGRDARKNLHACTRADCCGGALLKVVQMGGTTVSGRSDAHALEEYIGPAWQALMGSKKSDEARLLLQQAHAFCFANEHGKHRQAFERRSTPPGYWRADFPTTQEEVIDRRTADDMERKEVEDRHREAMREGGRWLFRDE